MKVGTCGFGFGFGFIIQHCRPVVDTLLPAKTRATGHGTLCFHQDSEVSIDFSRTIYEIDQGFSREPGIWDPGGVKDAWSITKGPVIGESVGNKSKTPSSSKAAASSKQQAIAMQPQAAKLEASAAVAGADSRSLALQAHLNYSCGMAGGDRRR